MNKKTKRIIREFATGTSILLAAAMTILLLLSGVAHATTALENQFAQNTLAIFWGSQIAVAIVLFGFFIAVVAVARLPLPIAAPLYAIGMIIMSSMVPAFQFVFIIVAGLVMASFIASIWRRKI